MTTLTATLKPILLSKGCIIFTLFLLSCHVKKNSSNQDDFFRISASTFYGHPFIMTIEDLKKKFGLPKEVSEGVSHIPADSTSDEVVSDSWFYGANDEFIFEVNQNFAHLSSVDFRTCQESIQNPDIVLTKDTRISEIEKIFPIAYQNRRIDATTFSFKYEWVRIKSEMQTNMKIRENIVELIFEAGKLIEFNYTWTAPK